jgi:protein PhnA
MKLAARARRRDNLDGFGKVTFMSDDEYVFNEMTGEWGPAGAATPAAGLDVEVAEVVRDAMGTILADGDSVVLIKDLKVKGAGQSLKQGTVIRSIRLTGNPEEIDCKYDAIKGLVLRTEFVRKR